MPDDHRSALVRIAQGALGNAVQHARADNVQVTLTYLDDMVVLDIVDDGCGFAPEAAAANGPGPDGRTGFGLRAMLDRMYLLGGMLTVESSPGEGTAVVASLPLPLPEPRGEEP
ncbi:sensor histidine kinase [Actinomadura sp. CNU-125]|uniref:sensor histidine kinase n=1 Tax=Actinomadura sp. CNU-125 TaxID=1904961 RepID=UPI0021CCCB7D|nr:ATP-binding protein [Actinomadura sp. CNU-125]